MARKVAALVCFDTCSGRFESNYERNVFFRGLYGWTQRVRRAGKEYEYRREGLLDMIPHIKVDSSVFIVAIHELKKVIKYMRMWEDKINYKTFRVLLEPDKIKGLEGKEIKIK